MLLRVAVDKGTHHGQALKEAKLPNNVLVVVVARDDEMFALWNAVILQAIGTILGHNDLCLAQSTA